jgi:hypothetical protein
MGESVMKRRFFAMQLAWLESPVDFRSSDTPGAIVLREQLRASGQLFVRDVFSERDGEKQVGHRDGTDEGD